jgi:hypothetical protein
MINENSGYYALMTISLALNSWVIYKSFRGYYEERKHEKYMDKIAEKNDL